MMQQDGGRTAGKSTSIWRKIWKVFNSPFLALVLILILVGLSLIGAFIVQVPPEYKTDAGRYNYWLQNVAQAQTGFWFPFLNAFGLFDVFHTKAFLGTGALLIISIVVCSVGRLKQTQISISLGPIRRTDSFYSSGQSAGESLAVPDDPETAGRIIDIIKKRNYRIRQDKESGNLYLVADKNRFTPLGTYLIHLSIILFIVGYLVGSFFGFKVLNFIVPEGAIREIGLDTGLSIKLDSFTDEYWPDGSPKDYRSEVVIYKDKQAVKSGVVQVNHPLSYGGVRIFQSFFGPATRVRISNADDGKVLFDGNIALNTVMQNRFFIRPAGSLHLIQEEYLLFFIGRATNTADEVLKESQIGIEVYENNSGTLLEYAALEKDVPYKLDKLEVTYLGDAQFSGFQISRDPGNNIIWAASGLFVLGLVGVFYFPRRRIWAMVQNSPARGSRLWIRADSGWKPGVEAEIRSLIQEIKREAGLKSFSGQLRPSSRIGPVIDRKQ